jgi:phage tail protein X
MQIARLQNEKSLTDLAIRVYGLKADDQRTAAAIAALTAANPHLDEKLANLPAGTPVIVPAAPGLTVQSGAAADPQRRAWLSALDQVLASAQQASNAIQTGSTATAPKTPDQQITKAMAALAADIAQFKRLHRG